MNLPNFSWRAAVFASFSSCDKPCAPLGGMLGAVEFVGDPHTSETPETAGFDPRGYHKIRASESTERYNIELHNRLKDV